MHVVIVSQPTDGGTAVHVLGLVRHLRSAGFEVDLYCPLDGWLGERGASEGASVHNLAMSRAPRPADLPLVFALRSAFRHADVVILQSSKAGAIGRLALSTIRRPDRPSSIFTPHGWSWLVGGILKYVYIAVEVCLQKVADAIVAVSTDDKREGERYLRRANIEVIRNGIDTAYFTPGTQVQRAKNRTTDPQIVAVGRLTHAKGQDLLIQALSMMEHRNVSLELVGDGEDRSRLEAIARHAGVIDRVVFRGSGDALDAYRSADLVVVPSRWDACSLVLLEALACGAAVICTPHVGAAIDLSSYVVVARSCEPLDIARAIDNVLADPEVRDSLRSRARGAITPEWTEQGSFRRHVDLVTKLANMPQSGARFR